MAVLSPRSKSVVSGSHETEVIEQSKRNISYLFLRRVHWQTGEELGTLTLTVFQ